MKHAAIRPILTLTACAVFLFGCLVPALTAAEAAKKTDDAGWILPDSALGGTWHLRLKDARAEAAKDDKPILILFTGPDWSSASKKMESSIIRSKEFTTSIRPAVVGLYIRHFVDSDAPDAQLEANSSLRKALNVPQVYPCTVLLGSDGKKILGILPGLPEKKAYLEWIAGLAGIKLDQ